MADKQPPIEGFTPFFVGMAPQYQKRKGKWGIEEENYTNKIIEAFNNGTLMVPEQTDGTQLTLRAYLAEKLNCDPMRITKKFTGASCLGKRVYYKAGSTNGNGSKPPPEEIARVNKELEKYEAAFLQKLVEQNREKQEQMQINPDILLFNYDMNKGLNGSSNGMSMDQVNSMMIHAQSMPVGSTSSVGCGMPVQGMQMPIVQPWMSGPGSWNMGVDLNGNTIDPNVHMEACKQAQATYLKVVRLYRKRERNSIDGSGSGESGSSSSSHILPGHGHSYSHESRFQSHLLISSSSGSGNGGSSSASSDSGIMGLDKVKYYNSVSGENIGSSQLKKNKQGINIVSNGPTSSSDQESGGGASDITESGSDSSEHNKHNKIIYNHKHGRHRSKKAKGNHIQNKVYGNLPRTMSESVLLPEDNAAADALLGLFNAEKTSRQSSSDDYTDKALESTAEGSRSSTSNSGEIADGLHSDDSNFGDRIGTSPNEGDHENESGDRSGDSDEEHDKEIDER